MQKISVFEISKGPKFAKVFVKEETDLTADMLAKCGSCVPIFWSWQADLDSGSWKNVKLKSYNFNAKGAVAESGALHPCMAAPRLLARISPASLMEEFV